MISEVVILISVPHGDDMGLPVDMTCIDVNIEVNFVTKLRAGGGLKKQGEAGNWRKRREKGQKGGEMSKCQVKVQQRAEATAEA